MEEERYVKPPSGDGTSSRPDQASDEQKGATPANGFQEEAIAKLDAILNALGVEMP